MINKAKSETTCSETKWDKKIEKAKAEIKALNAYKKLSKDLDVLKQTKNIAEALFKAYSETKIASTDASDFTESQRAFFTQICDYYDLHSDEDLSQFLSVMLNESSKSYFERQRVQNPSD